MKLNDGKKKNKAPAHIKQTEKPSRVKKTKAPKAEKKAPAPKKKTKGSGKGKIGLIIVLVVLALIVACAAAGVIYISGIDRIYPNVSLDGIDLGDMSLTEAAAVLDEAGYASQEGKELNVHLPLDFVLNVKAEEVCTETPIAELVQKVYDACSGGSPISDAVNYIKCRFAGMSLTSEVLITADSEAIAAKVDNMVQELQLALLSSDVSIGEESISVIKGAGASSWTARR